MHEPIALDRTPAPFRNVFACLVHEQPDCVVDLVRNLRRLDPDSHVVLYNGGADPGLLTGFPFARYGAVIHPAPRPMAWGRLHDFALDCMRFAVDHLAFDTLTIVDSDQLAARPGYTQAIAAALACRPNVGMLVSSPGVKGPEAGLLPVDSALAEIELWRPWLRRFANGPSHFVHWSFWPGTVFTRDAARDISRVVATDRRLASILERTQIFATEEVILPTLAALLGYKLAARPFNDAYTTFRGRFSSSCAAEALARPDVYWIHPVPREYNHPLRTAIRTAHEHYARPLSVRPSRRVTSSDAAAEADLIAEARRWTSRLGVGFDDGSLPFLIETTSSGLTEAGRVGPCGAVVVGHGAARLAALIAPAVRAVHTNAEVFALDPAAGDDEPAQPLGIRIVRAEPPAVPWAYPLGLLVLGGTPNYTDLATDFFHFEPWLVPGARITMHDGSEARTLADELTASRSYRCAGRAQGLVSIARVGGV